MVRLNFMSGLYNVVYKYTEVLDMTSKLDP